MCHASDTNNPLCTCADGYVGDTCNRLSITVSDLPLLSINQRSSLLIITASPQTIVHVVIDTIPPVTVSPSDQITISYPHTNASFYLQSSVESFVRLQFSVRSDDEEVSTIDDKVTVASVVNAAGNYFSGKSRNTLTEGCCKCDTNLTTKFCTGRPGQAIVLSSTCSWAVNSNNEYQSDGIIFVSVGTQSLPVSIIGTKIQLTDKRVAMDFTQPGVSCSSCHSGPDCNSLSPQSIQDIHDMVKHQSMIITFLSAVEHVLPKYISIEAYGASTKTHYSTSDYHTKIITGDDLQKLSVCPNLLIDNTGNNLYYVITTGSDLQFIYNNDQQYYTSTDRVCFVYPLCDDGLLFGSIPPQLSQQILNLTMFDDLLQERWKVNIKSIVTSRYGLSRNQFVSYWDGDVTTIMKPEYKLIAGMSITGSFHEQYLQVTFNFNGTATESNEVTSCQPVSMYTL